MLLKVRVFSGGLWLAAVAAVMLAAAFWLGQASPVLAQETGGAPVESTDPAAQPTQDVGQQIGALGWQEGPKAIPVSGNATLQLPAQHGFLNAAETAKFMTLTQNPSSNGEELIEPDTGRWFATISFSPDGYVKDDEKIDSAAVLDSLKEGVKQSNEELKSKGWPTLEIVGWRREPHYDETTKRLEWAFDIKDSQGNLSVNFQTRVLGRRGVEEFTLVGSPQNFEKDVADFNTVLTGYSFNTGDGYAEFKSGDKVAEYGLTALIAGGAAAVAAKTGIFKALFKFIWVGIAAVAVGIRAFFKRFKKTS